MVAPARPVGTAGGASVTNVARFAAEVGVPLDGLRDWSVSQSDAFWAAVSRLYGPPWSTFYERVRGASPTGPESWFPGGRTNIAAWRSEERRVEKGCRPRRSRWD